MTLRRWINGGKAGIQRRGSRGAVVKLEKTRVRPERGQLMEDVGDVHGEDEVDVERTGGPDSIWCTGKTKKTMMILLDIFSGGGVHTGHSNSDDTHGL